MLDRLAPSAAAVVVRAQEEARALRHPSLGEDHLLLALAADPGPVGELLRNAGLTPEELRAGMAPGRSATSGQVPFSPAARKALEAAQREDRPATAADLALALADRQPAVQRVRAELEAVAGEATELPRQGVGAPSTLPPEPWFRPPG